MSLLLSLAVDTDGCFIILRGKSHIVNNSSSFNAPAYWELWKGFKVKKLSLNKSWTVTNRVFNIIMHPIGKHWREKRKVQRVRKGLSIENALHDMISDRAGGDTTHCKALRIMLNMKICSLPDWRSDALVMLFSFDMEIVLQKLSFPSGALDTLKRGKY